MLRAPVEDLTEDQIEAAAEALYEEMNGGDGRWWFGQAESVRRRFKRVALITINAALKVR